MFECEEKWVCVKIMGYFNMYCVDGYVCKDNFIFFDKIFGMVYVRWIEIVNFNDCKWGFVWN